MKNLFRMGSVLMAVLLLAVVTQAKKPVATPGVTEYNGAVKSANVDVRGDIDGTSQRLHFIAKNQGKSNNTTVIFDNISGTGAGVIDFGNDGLWVTFGGDLSFPTINKASGHVPANGAVRVDGNVTYDPNTNTASGTGSIVQFDGNISIKAVIKSGGDRATMKGMINPTNATLNVFDNSSTVSSTPVNLSVKLPAIQLKAKK